MQSLLNGKRNKRRTQYQTKYLCILDEEEIEKKK